MYEIVAVRAESAGDHEHQVLVGYASSHLEGEAIMIPVERVIQRTALGESFGVAVDGEMKAVNAVKCEVCGHEPQLGPRDAILALPRK